MKVPGLIKNVLSLMRPHQWVKNFFIFPALIFSKHLLHPGYLLRSLAAFGIFCLLSSAVYIFNDIMDVEEDRHHPQKRLRPLAAGRMPMWSAWSLYVIFSGTALALSFALNTAFGLVAAFYYVINILYSSYLKRVALVDVLIVSFGFVFRAVAGGLAISVEISPWFLICTCLLALFLVLAKRRHEITLLDERANMLIELSIATEDPGKAFKYRKSLDDYSPYFLDQMIAVTTASTLMAYILYTLSQDVKEKFGGTDLVYTIPFVIYGIFRYLYLIHQKKEGGNPTKTLLNDRPLIIDVLLWGIVVIITIYFHRHA